MTTVNDQEQHGKPTFRGEDREDTAVSLRRRGYSYRRIANALGWKSKAGAYKAVERAMAREPVSDVAAVRRNEGGKLDEVEAELWRDIEALTPGDDARKRAGISNALLRCYERRAKLYGIDGEEIDWDAALERASRDAGIDGDEVVEAVEELMRAHATIKAERGG